MGNYGGPTETVALLPGSPASRPGVALSQAGVTTDQRGAARHAQSRHRRFQIQEFTLTAVAGSTPQSADSGAAFAEPLTVTLTANDTNESAVGQIVTFTVQPGSGGAGATLSATTVTIGAGGVAQVTATANSINGSYEVTASVAGNTLPVEFTLTNLIPLTFSVPPNQTVTYGTTSVTFSGTLADGSQTPTGEDVAVKFQGHTQQAVVGPSGDFSTTFTMPIADAGSTDTVTYSYASDGSFASAIGTTTLNVGKATPSVDVSDSRGTYDNSPFPATDTITGISGTAGTSLENITPSLAYYSGTYTSTASSTASPRDRPRRVPPGPTRSWRPSLAAPTTHPPRAWPISPSPRPRPAAAVTDPGGPYRRHGPSTATATVAGIGGTAVSKLEGVTPSLAYYSGTYTSTRVNGLTSSSTAPSAAGSYTVLATFAGSTDYASASGLANFTIAQATPSVTVTDPGGTYDGTASTATATVAGIGGTAVSKLEGVTPSLAYYSGTYTSTAQLNGLTSSSTAPSAAGPYTVLATFAGSTDYTAASDLADFTIAQATPTMAVTDPSGTYNGTASPATATVAGIGGTAVSKLEGVRRRWPITPGPTPARRSSTASPRHRPRRVPPGPTRSWPPSPAAPITPPPRTWPTSPSPRPRPPWPSPTPAASTTARPPPPRPRSPGSAALPGPASKASRRRSPTTPAPTPARRTSTT